MDAREAELDRFRDFALEVVREAAHAILPHFRASGAVVDKGTPGWFDPVTVADRAAEARIREAIRAAFPDHGIEGEEQASEPGSSPFSWVIDPIDGTRAFILGQLHWGTLLGLREHGRPVLGVMHQPYVDETFVGSHRGAELLRAGRSTPLRTSARTRLEEAIVCTTDPALFRGLQRAECFARLAGQVRMVRYGGDCYLPCLLAAGHVDLVVECGMKPWDIEPLLPLVQAAGGIVTDASGGPPADGLVVFAANATLHERALALLAT